MYFNRFVWELEWNTSRIMRHSYHMSHMILPAYIILALFRNYPKWSFKAQQFWGTNLFRYSGCIKYFIRKSSMKMKSVPYPPLIHPSISFANDHEILAWHLDSLITTEFRWNCSNFRAMFEFIVSGLYSSSLQCITVKLIFYA